MINKARNESKQVNFSQNYPSGNEGNIDVSIHLYLLKKGVNFDATFMIFRMHVNSETYFGKLSLDAYLNKNR